jgi:hypothetical protein
VQAAAGSLDPTKPAVQIPSDQRTLTVPLPKALSLAVLQVTARIPLVREDVRAHSDRAVPELQSEELRDAVRADPNQYPFSLKPLAARYSFKVEKQKDAANEPAPPEPTPVPLGG